MPTYYFSSFPLAYAAITLSSRYFCPRELTTQIGNNLLDGVCCVNCRQSKSMVTAALWFEVGVLEAQEVEGIVCGLIISHSNMIFSILPHHNGKGRRKCTLCMLTSRPGSASIIAPTRRGSFCSSDVMQQESWSTHASWRFLHRCDFWL